MVQAIDPEEDWELAGVVEQIAQQVGIRSSRNKDVSLVAMVGDTVIGGVLSAFYTDSHPMDENELLVTCDIDVVVHPTWQGYQRVGLRLIEEAMVYARDGGAEIVSAFVVNNRLARVLVHKYGFDGDDGSIERGIPVRLDKDLR